MVWFDWSHQIVNFRIISPRKLKWTSHNASPCVITWTHDSSTPSVANIWDIAWQFICRRTNRNRAYANSKNAHPVAIAIKHSNDCTKSIWQLLWVKRLTVQCNTTTASYLDVIKQRTWMSLPVYPNDIPSKIHIKQNLECSTTGKCLASYWFSRQNTSKYVRSKHAFELQIE